MNFKILLPCFFTGVLTFPSSATVPMDQDGDGMSDVWEIVHHIPVVSSYPAGELNLIGQGVPELVANYLPGGDPDEDGFTNLEESINGTDPFNFNPGSGKLSTLFTRSSSGTAISLIAQTVPAKHYSLLRSLDRLTWLPVAGADSGTQTSLTLQTVNAALPTGRQVYHYKVEVSDLDTDGDGLTDYEESLLGYNINGPTDLDGDGQPDEAKFLAQDLVDSPLHTLVTLAAKVADTSKTAEIFSSYNPTTGHATVNANSWAAGYDFTGVAWGDATAGTVITKKHLITVNHYTPPFYYPTTVKLVGKTTGTIYSIGVESFEVIPNEDLRLIRMVSADVAAMEAVEGPLTVYPILPARIHDEWMVMLRDGNGQLVSDATRPLAIQTEWDNRRAIPVSIRGVLFDFDEVDFKKPVTQYAHFYEDLTGGDSGHPVFFPTTGGKLVLIALNQGGGLNVSSGVPLFRSSLQTTLEAKVAADGYHLTLADPSTL